MSQEVVLCLSCCCPTELATRLLVDVDSCFCRELAFNRSEVRRGVSQRLTLLIVFLLESPPAGFGLGPGPVRLLCWRENYFYHY